MSIASRALVFAHYDKDNMVDDHVIFNLRKLRPFFKRIVFVSTSNLSDSEKQKLENLSEIVLIKENRGYDFHSYFAGLNALNIFQEPAYDELFLMNDSVYGPFRDLSKIFDFKTSADFWGLSDSYMMYPHLQSYFLVFKKTVYMSEVFRKFWQNLKIYSSRFEIVYHYEISLSHRLILNGFKMEAIYQRTSSDAFKEILFISKSILPFYLKKFIFTFFKRFFSESFLQNRPYLTYSSRHMGLNPTHDHFESLKHQIPYLKVSYFKEQSVRIEDLLNQIQSPYLQELFPLVKKHLKRVL